MKIGSEPSVKNKISKHQPRLPEPMNKFGIRKKTTKDPKPTAVDEYG